MSTSRPNSTVKGLMKSFDAFGCLIVTPLSLGTWVCIHIRGTSLHSSLSKSDGFEVMPVQVVFTSLDFEPEVTVLNIG